MISTLAGTLMGYSN